MHCRILVGIEWGVGGGLVGLCRCCLFFSLLLLYKMWMAEIDR